MTIYSLVPSDTLQLQCQLYVGKQYIELNDNDVPNTKSVMTSILTKMML